MNLGLGNDDATFDRLAECNLDFNRALPTQPRSVSFLPVADFTHVDVGPSGVHRVTTTWNQSAFGNALPVAPLCAVVRHIWDLVHVDNRHAEGGLSFRKDSWHAHDRSCSRKKPTSILQGNLGATLNCL